jgi:YD repeat-containing protein
MDENTGNDSVMTYAYGAESDGDQTITETDNRGSTTTTTYFSYGTPHYKWPVKIVEPDGQISTIIRQAGIGRVSRFSRGNQTTLYTYNGNKRLQTITRPEDGTTEFEYHPDGQLKSRSNTLRVVNYEYYPNNLLHKETFTDSRAENVTREYRYDNHKNLEYAITTSTNGTQNNTLQYTYDSDNNVTIQTLRIDGQVFSVAYDYDELSNVREITYPNNRLYALDPNSLGRATSIQELGGQGKVVYDLVQYNDNHSMKLMQRRGHQVKNELNIGQRPFKYRVEKYGYGATGPMGEREYVYDRVGNIRSINDTLSERFVLFKYDSRNRLINENTNNGVNWSFGYLPNDDIDWIQEGGVRSSYEYDPRDHRLMGVKSSSNHLRYGYDGPGNMTVHERLQDDSKITRILTYNAANQLAAMNDGTTYSYDARGLRVKQDRNGAIYTLYDHQERLIYRWDDQTKVSSEYFYVDGKLVARRDHSTDQPEQPPQSDPPTSPPGGITVSGRTISWPDDGWYQVQTDNGRTTVCEGGRSCTVPSAGTYKVINHSTDTKTYLDIL